MSSDTELDEFITLACTALGRSRNEVDLPRLVELAGRVAAAGPRPMAPVSAYLVGRAVATGLTAEQAASLVVAALPTEPLPDEAREDHAAWQAFVDRACARLGLDPASVPTAELPERTRAIARASTRRMAPVAGYLLGLTHDSDEFGTRAQRLLDVLT